MYLQHEKVCVCLYPNFATSCKFCVYCFYLWWPVISIVCKQLAKENLYKLELFKSLKLSIIICLIWVCLLICILAIYILDYLVVAYWCIYIPKHYYLYTFSKVIIWTTNYHIKEMTHMLSICIHNHFTIA